MNEEDIGQVIKRDIHATPRFDIVLRGHVLLPLAYLLWNPGTKLIEQKYPLSCFVCRRYADREGCVCTRGDDRCTVDVAKRNDCMSCRIKKCYDVGMKKVRALQLSSVQICDTSTITTPQSHV